MIVRRAGHLSYHGAAVALTLVVLLFNARLYSPRGAEYNPDRLGADIVPGLRFVGAARRGARMQDVFPEGYFFAQALYGLSWVEVGLRQPPGTRASAALGPLSAATGQLSRRPGFLRPDAPAAVRRVLRRVGQLAAQR